MNLAEWSLQNRVVVLVLTAVMFVGGLASYQSMPRLEDPEFTIKDALVITPYPGASAYEVEEEVTDEIELAVQQLGQLREIESKSDRGLSTLTITIKDKYDKESLPQVWDELRRKVGDAQSHLPPGAGPSLVIDDYGDVFGVFVAIYGPEFDYAELKRVVDFLRRELLLVQDVAKIDTFGERTEAVYVELDRDRLSQLSIPPSTIIGELQQRNAVTDAGRVRSGNEFITLSPGGGIDSVEDFGSILISTGQVTQVYLRDVAKIRRGYVEPPDHALRYDGNTAIGLGISTVSGGNVVVMGSALRQRLTELQAEIPLGIEFGIVSLQSQAVTVAISGFVNSLLQAVAIVVAVLLLFMGVRSALLIGFVLLLTIAGSFIFLSPMGVALERISLGALIIALGMLVDNAIVVVDGMLIRMQQGESPEHAASAVVAQTSIPLLGATVIAILAFAAIGTSQDSTGEFCRSLYQVVLVSLLLSWVTAVTVTPVLGAMFLKAGSGDGERDPYGGAFYGGYRVFLKACIRLRGVTLTAVVVVFALAVWGFGFIDQSFFPPSTRPQFLVDLWLPQGTHIKETEAQSERIEDYLRKQEGVTHVTSLLGRGGLRFLLTYTPEKLNSGYAQLLVDVDDAKYIDGLIAQLERELPPLIPDGLVYGFKFELGPASNGKIRARLSGPDPDKLRELASRVEGIFHADPDGKAVRTDWNQRVKIVRPLLIQETVNENGLRRQDVAAVLRQGFQGVSVGIYREGDLLLPILVRADEEQRTDIASANNLQVWSPAAKRAIPLRQVVSRFDSGFEDEIVMRRDRRRTLTVFADPIDGTANAMLARVRPQVEAIPLDVGYALEWGGEYEDSGNAQAAIAGSIPLFVLVMFLVTVILFNSLRQPAVIWLCVPLAIIGVTVGLLGTGQPFGFMALLGFLSLMGMLIKNAIVLVDEINEQNKQGKAPLVAIMDSGTSRLRPVAMAAATTALGMIPLLFDAFFVSMAVTIIGGLAFATGLTMVVVPVLYSVFFGVRSD